MFNTREYEWSDVTVVLGGRDVTGLRGIAYSEAQEKEALYAKGNKPHGIQRGNKSYTGSVRILQSELLACRQLPADPSWTSPSTSWWPTATRNRATSSTPT